MTPERRKEVVTSLRGEAAGADAVGNEWFAGHLRDAADALESAGKCGFCGREVHAALKPMCGDCAGKEDPSTAALRADLAKAKKEREALRGYVELRLVAEIRRLREALTRYGARHDVDCPMNPESGYQPPLRCTCGLLEMKG